MSLKISFIQSACVLLPVAYVLDTGFHVFFWVGKEASSQVRSRGFAQAKVHDSVLCKVRMFTKQCCSKIQLIRCQQTLVIIML